MVPRGSRGTSRRGQTPLGERRRRVITPLVLQTHATECGAACLGSVLAHFGRWVPLTELRGTCEVGRDGSTAAGLKRAAEHYGLECSGWSVQVDRLRGMPLPMVLFWEFNHFVVLEGFDRKWFYLNDPASGYRRLSPEEFDAGFTGVTLKFRPGPAFEPGGTPSGLLRRLPLWLSGAWGGLAWAVVCGLMLAVLALTAPFAAGLFVDRVLGDGETWGRLVAGALAGAALLVYGVTWLKQRFLWRLAIRISIVAGNRSVSQLLRLPVDYFSHRLVGDLTARILSIDRVAQGLSERVLGLLVDVAMSVVFLAVMLALDLPLALAVLALAFLNVLLLRPIARVRSDEASALRREQGLMMGIGTIMLNQADALRMTAAEDRMFARWSGHQARELQVRQRFSELGNLMAAAPDLFTILGSAAVLALGATKVMSGELTLGALLAFYLVATMFLEPVGRFVEFAHERQTLLSDMQRLDDITETPVDPGLARRAETSRSIATLNGRLRLAGHVELRGVTFGYNRNRPPLIKDFSLVFKPGQRVAVVGPSGSGKSTLSRLVAGILHPWSGEILFDGRPRDEIPGEVLSRSLSMVDQRIVLFSATVRDNLTLWNPTVLDDDVVAAARDAAIHDDILSRPRGYATPVDEDGGNFSGGQRQRLEIARSLVGNPTVLILDEATSALDAATEAHVDDALRRRGISCLIVAHRLSTIRDCDQIIVVDKGVAVQRGTHDGLMAETSGVYHRLVRTELAG
ncbi:cysteine peptidase family C39 domain-containing protein [Candidatus Palauibacter sp.]|uniref:cysteine peptidase family C39 domain-containing protein n=1 Tax=Candidatus Palauibacter sp. TaxID=3101350 RepID=UPI003B517B94